MCISDTFIDIAVLPQSPQLTADEDRPFRAVPVLIGDTAARAETPEAGGSLAKPACLVLIETTMDKTPTRTG